MSSKKTPTGEPFPEKTNDDNPKTGEQPVPVDEQIVETTPSMEDLKKQLGELQSLADEYKDGWQRSVADFQNYKRRVEAEKGETYQTALGSVIKRYLPIVDDLERALAARPENLAWADGIELIYRKLKGILDAEGIKRIEAEGQTFDPRFHEAISQEPSDDHASGQIISVVQNGYMLGNRVIRPAVVRVAK
jgi:molecular chaperone GrpE